MKPNLRTLLLLLALLPAMPARAQQEHFDFKAPPAADAPGLPAAMSDLADRILPVYQDDDSQRYLATLSALQLVAGNPASAQDARQNLRNRRPKAGSPGSEPRLPIGRAVLFDLYIRARAEQAGSGTSFAVAYTHAFQALVPKLDDLDAWRLSNRLRLPPEAFRARLQSDLDRFQGVSSLSQPQALELVWDFLGYQAYRDFGPLVEDLIAADDAARYQVQDDVRIKTAGGHELHARWVLPRHADKPLTALMEFSIDGRIDDARACAAHGYAGVMVYARGKDPDAAVVAGRDAARLNREPGTVVPFEHDGEDARAAIAWIAHQDWSDGRVGMFGDGYSGFAAWAAARHPPAALKAIATADPWAPGVDFPMDGHIFHTDAYEWAVTHGHAAEEVVDRDYWDSIQRRWYESGRSFRALDQVDDLANRFFRRWLDHPSYDGFWQRLIPYRRQFAHVKIPVLTLSGYYAAHQAGALYYFEQHLHYLPDAAHTLLIGPYDEDALRQGPGRMLRGYALDPSAAIDPSELRFSWFDHIFKGGALPGPLRDRVNLQLMGADQWRHASTLAGLSTGTQRYYLDAGRGLSAQKPPRSAGLKLSVNLAARKDASGAPSQDLVLHQLVLPHAVSYQSPVFKQGLTLSGRLSGHLDFKVNKMDMDLDLVLYEKLSGGDYLRLSEPCELRASYLGDPVHRRLLKAGERQQRDFRCPRMLGRSVQAGSRLVLVLGIVKRAGREVDYGTGADVSVESAADARVPLKLEWYGASYIELPLAP